MSVDCIELAPRTQDADDGRHYRKNDDYRDDIVDALSNIWNRAPERVSPKNHRADPEDASKDVERDVTPVRHLRCASHWRAKRSNDGNKAR